MASKEITQTSSLAKKFELSLATLSLLISLLLVYAFYEPISSGVTDDPIELASLISQGELIDNLQDVSGEQISRLSNLFGVPVVPQDFEEAVYQALPETPLNLKLFGTIAHSTEERSSAWISANNNSPARYFLNQKIEAQSELVHIAEGYVVLRRNGEDELLKLPMMKDLQTGPELDQRIYQ